MTTPGGPRERIAVLRALPGLGDFLCAVPALRALRAGHPDAELTLIGLPSTAGLVERFGHYLDELLPFPGFPGIPEVPLDPPRTVAFLADAQRRPYDLAIQMHGSGIATNPFVALLGARRVAGLFVAGLPVPDPELFLPYPADVPEPVRYLALMEFLGLPAHDVALEFPLLPDDEAAWQELAERHGLSAGGYACVNPGAAEPRRRWPADRFAAVADVLARRGLTIVLTGSAAERGLTAAVAAAMRAPAVDVAGQTTLGSIAAFLAHAALTVTNDTGTSHLAAALGAPSAVVFSASDPRRWAPIDGSRHRALGAVHAPRSAVVGPRCLRDGCRRYGDPVLGEVTVDHVLAACDGLLSTAPSGGAA
jgi:ADP-heptose:LPS heptosyltransferase